MSVLQMLFLAFLVVAAVVLPPPPSLPGREALARHGQSLILQPPLIEERSCGRVFLGFPPRPSEIDV